MASNDYTGGGPFSKADQWHAIMVCGTKEEEVPHKTMKGAAHIVHYIGIGCSVKGFYWIEVNEFLQRHGGYNTILVELK